MNQSQIGSARIQRRQLHLAASSILVLIAGFAQPAIAQTAPTAVNSVETVTVTARRREENLEKVPVAASVLTRKDIQNRQITTQSDIQLTTPGLIYRQTQDRNQANYSVRGQSIDAYSNSQPGVLAYYDEFQDGTVTEGSFYDLSSIQVLKGPQGTLFGRNTTGGAVLFTTARPEINKFGGYLHADYGNYNEERLEAAVNIPVSDQLAIRVAGEFHRRDGYVKNVVSGQDLDGLNIGSARVSLLWRPTDRFQNTLVVQTDHSGGSADALELYSVNRLGQTSTGADHLPLVTTTALYFSDALDTLAGPGAFAALQNATPGAPAGGILGEEARQRAASPWKTWLTGRLYHHADGTVVVDTTTYKIDPHLTVKNIVGYTTSRNADDNDVDGTPYLGISGTLSSNNRQWSDETQLSGDVFDQRLNFIAGSYFGSQTAGLGQSFHILDLGPVADPLFGLPLHNLNIGESDDTTEGAFAQGTYKLDQLLTGLSFTAGARYTWEQIRFQLITGFPGSNLPHSAVERSADSKPSWQVGFEYQALPELLVYVESRGSWRSGGFNQSAPPFPVDASAGGNKFDPEETHDVEVGAKYQGRIGSAAARVNIALYNQWVDNIQRVVYLNLPSSGLTGLTANIAGGAVFRGVELDADIRPIEWLDIGGAFSAIDAGYGNPHNVSLFGSYVNFDTIADIAKYSGSVYAEVSLPLPARWGEASLRGELYAQTGQYFSNNGKSSQPGTQLPGYHIVNLRAAWNDVAGSNVSLAIFVKNALNQPYYVGGIALGDELGLNAVLPGEPRFYGVELGYKF